MRYILQAFVTREYFDGRKTWRNVTFSDSPEELLRMIPLDNQKNFRIIDTVGDQFCKGHFGQKLKELIKERKTRGRDVGRKLGYSSNFIWYYFRKKTPPPMPVLERICGLLGVEPSYFMENGNG